VSKVLRLSAKRGSPSLEGNKAKDSDLKLDLHTHCFEAMNFPNPTVDRVKEIITAVKDRGLDGIAVTEHNDKAYGYKTREIVDRYFGGEILIIPGQEVDARLLQIVELYLPSEVTFRFIAHPGYPYIQDISCCIDDSIHGIEFRNPLHDRSIDSPRIKELAEKHGLLLLTNSDAHNLNNIGHYYNEIEIEELCARARK
jgi:histidinol phosphatase-like PHP family hydrolase